MGNFYAHDDSNFLEIQIKFAANSPVGGKMKITNQSIVGWNYEENTKIFQQPSSLLARTAAHK